MPNHNSHVWVELPTSSGTLEAVYTAVLELKTCGETQ